MANGILKVSNIETSSGSGTITLGQSGETVTIASGVTQTIAVNTPAFQATTSGSTTMANQTATKIAFASEIFDTDNAYDTSTSRFTPQTAGKYAITANIRFNSGTDFNDNILRLSKNGSRIFQNQQ